MLPPAPIPVNTVLGMWKVDKRLYSGAYSEVYIGNRTGSDEKYALKIYNDLDDYRHPIALNEIRVLKRLKHVPAVIPLADLFFCDHKSVLVLPLLAEKNVEEMLKLNPTGHFIKKNVLRFAMQALNVLDEIHKRNVIHRSIKDTNFVLSNNTANARLLLIDFGGAKEFKMAHQKMIPVHETFNEAYNKRSYAPPATMIQNEWTMADDCSQLAYLLLKLAGNVFAWYSIDKPLCVEKKIRLDKNPKNCIKRGLEWLVPLITALTSAPRLIRPDYGAMHRVIYASLEEGEWMPRDWTFGSEDRVFLM